VAQKKVNKMTTDTLDPVELGHKVNTRPDTMASETAFFHFTVNLHPEFVEREATEEEILSLPHKIGMFSFLDDEEEDIYTKEDGSLIE